MDELEAGGAVVPFVAKFFKPGVGSYHMIGSYWYIHRKSHVFSPSPFFLTRGLNRQPRPLPCSRGKVMYHTQRPSRCPSLSMPKQEAQ